MYISRIVAPLFNKKELSVVQYFCTGPLIAQRRLLNRYLPSAETSMHWKFWQNWEISETFQWYLSLNFLDRYEGYQNAFKKLSAKLEDIKMLFSNHSTMLQIPITGHQKAVGTVVCAKKQLCKYLSSKIANLFACLLNSANKETTHFSTTLCILAFFQSRKCRKMFIIPFPLSVG